MKRATRGVRPKQPRDKEPHGPRKDEKGGKGAPEQHYQQEYNAGNARL